MSRPPESRKCSIVIRALNEQEHIGRLLQGIQRQTVRDAEIIVVDSGSTDATTKIAHASGAKVLSIRSTEFTFGRSLNLGIRAASRPLVVIASAHVYPVYQDWLECLLRPFDNPRIALSYGKQRTPESARFSEGQIFHQWYPNSSQANQLHPFCNNANAAIRRDLWLQHAYDETLPGLEDLAWAKCVLEAGYSLAYVAEAEIVHIHHENWKRIFNRYKREAMAMKRIYPASRFSVFDFLQLTATNILSDCWHAHQKGLLTREWLDIFLYRISQFYGTFIGYRQVGALTESLRKTFYYPVDPRARPKPVPRPVRAIDYAEGLEAGGE